MKHLFLNLFAFEYMNINDAVTFVNLRLATESRAFFLLLLLLIFPRDTPFLLLIDIFLNNNKRCFKYRNYFISIINIFSRRTFDINRSFTVLLSTLIQ